MLEALLMLVAGLLGWLLASRQKPTEPPTHPDPRRTHPDPPKFEDKIDEITKHNSYPESDRDLARWLDDNAGGKRK